MLFYNDYNNDSDNYNYNYNCNTKIEDDYNDIKFLTLLDAPSHIIDYAGCIPSI